MRSIVAKCPHGCGEVKVEVDQIQLWVSAKPELSHYTYTCPNCSQACAKPASDETQGKLVALDVVPQLYEPPLELEDDDARWDGGELKVDDVLDAMNAIEQYNATGQGMPWST